MNDPTTTEICVMYRRAVSVRFSPAKGNCKGLKGVEGWKGGREGGERRERSCRYTEWSSLWGHQEDQLRN